MPDFSRYKTLRIERDGPILTVVLNRPEQLNAVDELMHEELATVFGDCAADAGSEVIVLTGAGRAFCAGGDLRWLEAMATQPQAFAKTAAEAKLIINGLLDCDKPVIARVNGHATGLGCTIALFCDLVFAAEKARIGDPHVSVGLVAGDGGAVIWPQLVGYARAKEFLLTGDLLAAPEAARIGLINRAVPESELDPLVRDFAMRLAAGATKAIRWTKATINIGLRQLAGTMMDASLAYEALSNQTADHREAVRAIIEKRAPRFSGS